MTKFLQLSLLSFKYIATLLWFSCTRFFMHFLQLQIIRIKKKSLYSSITVA